MTSKRYIYVALAVCLLIIAFATQINKCKLSDNDAINIAKLFYNNMSIGYASEPFVKSKNITELFEFGTNSKIVVVGDSDNKIIINCSNNNVEYFINTNILHLAQTKYTFLINNKLVLKWPSFLSEQNAIEIIMSYAKRIGLPQDFECSKINLDKYKGMWTARWKRKFNGIEFEDDYIILSIMATDGELYGYTKWEKGEQCSTEPKVSKAEAIGFANKKFAEYFSKDTWDKNKDKFEVKSAELKIVQDKSNLKRILSLPNKSRLAWVVVFDTKKEMDRETIGILKEDLSFIRIDAATKEILSSEINVVL